MMRNYCPVVNTNKIVTAVAHLPPGCLPYNREKGEAVPFPFDHEVRVWCTHDEVDVWKKMQIV